MKQFFFYKNIFKKDAYSLAVRVFLLSL